jgi:hypothetical protein
MIEAGATLKEAEAATGIPYATIQYRAARECWVMGKRGTGRPRIISEERVKKVEEGLERAERMVEAGLRRAERLAEAEKVVVRAENLEVMAKEGLGKYSARLKLKLARVVDGIADELEGLGAKEKAQAAAAVSLVCERLFKWDKDLSAREEELASKGMINLSLIATRPEDLKRLALESKEREMEVKEGGG